LIFEILSYARFQTCRIAFIRVVMTGLMSDLIFWLYSEQVPDNLYDGICNLYF